MGVPVVGSIGRKVFGSRNDRLVKRYMKLVDQVSLKEGILTVIQWVEQNFDTLKQQPFDYTHKA